MEVIIVNFYISNSIDEIKEQDINVEFSDELINYIYKLSKKEKYDFKKIYEIDPYMDIIVPKEDLHQIIEECNLILNAALLQGYEDPDEGNQMLRDLLHIAQMALSKNSGLVSIGD